MRRKVWVDRRRAGSGKINIYPTPGDETLGDDPMTPHAEAASTILNPAQVEAFCRKWGVDEFALFGSAVRDDFGPDSDVDVLVRLRPGAAPGWQDWLAMEAELQALVGRDVDLVDADRIRNPFRRRSILGTKKVIYDRRAG